MKSIKVSASKESLMNYGARGLGSLCCHLIRREFSDSVAGHDVAISGDYLLKSFTSGFRMSILNNTNSTREAIQRNKVNNPNETRLLGRTMSAASLMASFLKGEERIHLDVRFKEGPITSVFAEAVRLGSIRGNVSRATSSETDRVDLLTVNKILYNRAKPVMSCIELTGKDITSDLQSFFDTSDQNPSIVSLETTVDDQTGDVVFSGGYLIQSFPDQGHELKEMRNKIKEITENGRLSFYNLVQQNQGDLFKLSTLFLLGEKNEAGSYVVQSLLNSEGKSRIDSNVQEIAFNCSCSMDNVINSVVRCGPAVVDDIIRRGGDTITCDFCSQEYRLQPSDFKF